MFIDRDRELQALERDYRAGRAALYVLYGRRRVGKTELLRAFCAGKRHLFFVADLGTETAALAEFTRQVSELAYDRPDAIGPFPSWDVALDFVARLAETERLVLVLDEFTYLIGANAAIPSILQRMWDTRLRDTQLMLVLCGSYVGMMEQHVLGYRAPLYGRRTAQWHLEPLRFAEAAQFLPGFAATDQVRAYATLGGVPAYLLQFDDRLSLLDNIEQRILATGTFLYDEPRFLLLQELGDPRRYFSILEAIAGGRTRQNDIAQAVGVAATSIPFYLGTLRGLGLVERMVPVTETQPQKSRRALYRIRDRYFRFWFRFVHPNHSLLERGATAGVRRQIEEQFDQYTGPVFEAICQDYIWRLAETGQVGFIPRAVGRWWDDREEIDLVAFGDDHILLAECKWSTRPVGADVLEELNRKAQALLRRGTWPRVHHVLFSRSGFAPSLESRAAAEGISLVDLDTLCR